MWWLGCVGQALFTPPPNAVAHWELISGAKIANPDLELKGFDILGVGDDCLWNHVRDKPRADPKPSLIRFNAPHRLKLALTEGASEFVSGVPTNSSI